MTLDLERFKKRSKAKRKRTLSAEIRSGYSMLLIVVIALNLILGATYFIINGQKTVLGYKLKQLQTLSGNLKDEARKIDGEIVNATAVRAIEKEALERKMAEIQYMIYTAGSVQTARR